MPCLYFNHHFGWLLVGTFEAFLGRIQFWACTQCMVPLSTLYHFKEVILGAFFISLPSLVEVYGLRCLFSKKMHFVPCVLCPFLGLCWGDSEKKEGGLLMGMYGEGFIALGKWGV